MDSTVYVNGVRAGGRRYGYSCFSVDISGYLRRGGNEICVRVRYQSPNSRWYSGAGIIRNVTLRRTDKRHICENGVYIASKQYGENWIVIIETQTECADGRVRHSVFDRSGKKLAVVRAVQRDGLSRVAFCAAKPVKWEPEQPVTYKMVTALRTSSASGA